MKPFKIIGSLSWLVLLVILCSCVKQKPVVEKPSRPMPESAPTVTSPSSSPISISTLSIDFRSYVGLNVPPFPDKTLVKGSTLIDTAGNYGLHLVLSDTKVFMIWFTKSERVIYVLPLPDLEKMDSISTNYCSVDAKEDPEIITISTFDDEVIRTRFFTNSKIRKAWRANRTSGVIESISTKGIECSAEGGFDPSGITSQR